MEGVTGFEAQARFPSVLDNQLVVITAGFIAILVATRIVSGILGHSKKTPEGNTVPLIPYWIPIIGHLPSFLLNSRNFLDWARRSHTHGAFALNLGGTTHNIIFKPALGQVVMNQRNEVADGASVSKYIMGSVFGFPKAESNVYDKALPDILDCYKHLSSSPGLPRLIAGAVQGIRTNINNLVTFSKSPVDQMYWERKGYTKTEIDSSGEQVEDVDLYVLVRDFVAQCANPALFGTDFVNNNPDVWRDLWKLDGAFMRLVAGLPRWVPIPGLVGGHIARRRLFDTIIPFEVALDKWAKGQDPGSEWSNLDDVSELLKARAEVYQRHGLSIEARAAVEVALIWAMNANANPLIFWLLCRVYSDPVLLEQIREEVRPHLKIQVPSGQFGVAELPTLEDVDQEGLAEKCPLLKAAYIESLRLDTGVWSFKIMKEDLTISTREKDAQKFSIKKGTYCHVAHELHHRDANYYDEPDVWRVGRHIKYEPSKDASSQSVPKADMGTVRPYGGGHSMCKGRQFALKEILIFSASIFTFWDMEPARSGGWKIPAGTKATGTNGINGEMRVKIKRRSIPK